MNRDSHFLDEVCNKLILLYEYKNVPEEKICFESAYQMHTNKPKEHNDAKMKKFTQNMYRIFQASKLERNYDGSYCYGPLEARFPSIFETFLFLNRLFPTVEILNGLGWREYESLITAILDRANFFSIHTFRFQSLKKRFEIDIIARKGSFIFVIDAKRWKSSTISPAKLEFAAKDQQNRLKCLLEDQSAKEKLKACLSLKNLSKKPRKFLFIPLIVVSNNLSYSFLENGIPVIDFLKFEDFTIHFNMATKHSLQLPYVESFL